MVCSGWGGSAHIPTCGVFLHSIWKHIFFIIETFWCVRIAYSRGTEYFKNIMRAQHKILQGTTHLKYGNGSKHANWENACFLSCWSHRRLPSWENAVVLLPKTEKRCSVGFCFSERGQSTLSLQACMFICNIKGQMLKWNHKFRNTFISGYFSALGPKDKMFPNKNVKSGF